MANLMTAGIRKIVQFGLMFVLFAGLAPGRNARAATVGGTP
ncbi:MAG TPA: hypothetical protein VIV15_09550 [Anaerolineales bacterium]